ncbi:MAG: hypothetical protein R6U65_12500 [Perlabentimonas sp.]
MLITRDNYESYFIDFIDGNLSQREKDLLYLFLEENPDLKQEFDGITDTVLLKPEYKYQQKETLKKADFNKLGVDNEFDYLCIAESENDITLNERKDLEKLLAGNETNKRVRSLISRIKLKPDLTQNFPNKNSLKRTPIFSLPRKTIVSISSAAAGLALLAGVFTLINIVVKTESPQIVAYQNPENIKAPRVVEDDSLNGKSEQQAASRVKSITKPKVGTEKITTSNVPITSNIPEKRVDDNRVITAVKTVTTIKPTNLEVKSIADLAPKLPVTNERFINKKSPKNRTILAVGKGGSREMTFIDFAQRGVNRLAEITGANINLDSDKDSEGKLKKISFESTLFAVSVPVNRRKD